MKNAFIGISVVFVAASAPTMGSRTLPKIAVAESPQETEQSTEERAVRDVVAAGEAAWNKHDAAAMDAPFVDDCDFVNVFGEWISGHDKLVKLHTGLFAGPFRDIYKRFDVEKVRFVRPDVAVVLIRNRNVDRDGRSPAGNEGTAIGFLAMVKERGTWRIVAGQNTIVRPLPAALRQPPPR